MADALLTIGIVIFPGVEELDFVGPFEVFTQTAELADRGLAVSPRPVTRLVARTLDPVTCTGGMRVLPDESFQSCPKLDVLLVPGGPGTRPLAKDEEMLAFIAARAAEASWVTSVCTGSALLGAAGLLDGRPATTHWAAFDFLAASAPKATLVRDRRVVVDGNLVTSAGVSAGIDMALRLVGMIHGRAIARAAQKGMQYAPEPPYSAHEAG